MSFDLLPPCSTLAHGVPGLELSVLAIFYVLSVLITLAAAFLSGWPNRRKLAKGLSIGSLALSSPVLLLMFFLPSILGIGDAAAIMLGLLLSPAGAVFLLFKLK